MNLELVNSIINNAKNNKFIQNFMKELQNYLEKNVVKNNYGNMGRKEGLLMNLPCEEKKIISKFRDKMNIERNNILKQYAKQTIDEGKMYYIYSRNSENESEYNLCMCEEGNSHIVIKKKESELPEGSKLGSVLRNANDENYILDSEATEKISEKIEKLEECILEEQAGFLNSMRIEGHIYEISEKGTDRVWLFDVTNSNDYNEEIEEIDFPLELLNDSNEGDSFIFINGEYKKHQVMR